MPWSFTFFYIPYFLSRLNSVLISEKALLTSSKYNFFMLILEMANLESNYGYPSLLDPVLFAGNKQ